MKVVTLHNGAATRRVLAWSYKDYKRVDIESDMVLKVLATRGIFQQVAKRSP